MSDKKFVIIGFNLFCEWQKAPPAYRLYVDDELLTERTYIWAKDTKRDPCDFWIDRQKLCKLCTRLCHTTCRQAKDDSKYLHEVLPLKLSPGVHKIRLQSLSKKAKFNIRNLQVKEGTVNIIDSTTFEVLECGQ